MLTLSLVIATLAALASAAALAASVAARRAVDRHADAASARLDRIEAALLRPDPPRVSPAPHAPHRVATGAAASRAERWWASHRWHPGEPAAARSVTASAGLVASRAPAQEHAPTSAIPDPSSPVPHPRSGTNPPVLIAVPDLSGPGPGVGTQADPARRASAARELSRRFERVWSMADAGSDAAAIAAATGQPIGQVEVVLNLRRRLEAGAGPAEGPA